MATNNLKRMDVDVKYTGNAEMLLHLVLGRENINITVPIQIQDFIVKGRVKKNVEKTKKIIKDAF